MEQFYFKSVELVHKWRCQQLKCSVCGLKFYVKININNILFVTSQTTFEIQTFKCPLAR